MKLRLFAAAGAAILLSSAPSAHAATLWDNGAAVADGGYCDQEASSCGESGWTIYDDFQISAPSIVTGLTYDTNLYGATYTGTNYSIWNVSPLTNYSDGPIYSGTLVGSVSDDSVGYSTISLTGLSDLLSSGTYYVGFQNDITDPNGTTSYVETDQSHLGSAFQIADGYTYTNTGLQDAAFTVQGAAVSAAPEPASWALMFAGIAGLGLALRRNKSAGVSLGAVAA